MGTTNTGVHLYSIYANENLALATTTQRSAGHRYQLRLYYLLMERYHDRRNE